MVGVGVAVVVVVVVGVGVVVAVGVVVGVGVAVVVVVGVRVGVRVRVGVVVGVVVAVVVAAVVGVTMPPFPQLDGHCAAEPREAIAEVLADEMVTGARDAQGADRTTTHADGETQSSSLSLLTREKMQLIDISLMVGGALVRKLGVPQEQADGGMSLVEGVQLLIDAIPALACKEEA